MNISFDDVLERLKTLSPEELKAVEKDVMSATKDMLWVPNPGPQTDAYYCEADELFYGGQAGGGKSALINGLAVTCHERSLILRRIRDDAKKMAESELLGGILGGNREGWNGSDLLWRNGKQLIHFGGCEQEQDKQRYKGNPHDLICFDEVTDFLESQYEFITIWNRSTTPGQRCRVVATGNPPTSASGLWVIRRWAAWLDPSHPNPAKPGELRWYIRNEVDEEVEVDGYGPHGYAPNGTPVYARSRTFIPAKLSDNPDFAQDGNYATRLNMLPRENEERTIMGGAAKAVGNVVGSILGSSGSNVTVDTADETTAPTEDTQAVKDARRRSIVQSQQRSGRSSTILTGSSNNKLGG